ncbi:TetR/AcrR family transcriptional regulator [Williamsia sp. CHRR-6]|uniref:TetR/AcrR family transcriptional regulator n=1 Tax=Williamsia sp. CHRR-6 TaxID=2835871 RepID=UPI001BDA8743|nr:TetR family transcriptional regulator [Williamsia sp. CHRR-6]MBT0565699.1 TetR family transcriptional regulator [Williamsia sp. CHRR-6]
MLRASLLDGVRELLVGRPWSSVTMTDVATAAGVSRQTVYNEFGSRAGLAQAYAVRLTDEFVGVVSEAIADNIGHVHQALRDGFGGFFLTSAGDPLVQSLLSGDAAPDLLKLITTDAAPLITRASERLASMLQQSWLALEYTDAQRVGRAISRMALSYIAMPPEGDRDVADDLAGIFAPVLLSAARPTSG